MSRRTAEANKAIRLAWQREHDLVQVGKGTRDLTEEQQKDILDPDKGKAYDDKGRAFEGQHMKSVEKYPEYQGDSNNIQFLTKDEHLDAHQGNWQNPTNWYYDPATKQITDFGEGKYIPCPVIELSHPIITVTVNIQDNGSSERTPNKTKTHSPPKEQPTSTAKKVSAPKAPVVETKTTKEESASPNKIKKGLVAFGAKLKIGGKIAGHFLAKHWKKIVVGGLAIGAAVVEEKMRNGGSGSESGNFDHYDDYDPPDYSIPDEEDIYDSESDCEQDDIFNEGTSGTPKRPHPRRGHPHKYNTKNGVIIHMLDDIFVNGYAPESEDSDEDNSDEAEE